MTNVGTNCTSKMTIMNNFEASNKNIDSTNNKYQHLEKYKSGPFLQFYQLAYYNRKIKYS